MTGKSFDFFPWYYFNIFSCISVLYEKFWYSKVTLFNQGFNCVNKLSVLNKNLQIIRRKRVEK